MLTYTLVGTPDIFEINTPRGLAQFVAVSNQLVVFIKKREKRVLLMLEFGRDLKVRSVRRRGLT